MLLVSIHAFNKLIIRTFFGIALQSYNKLEIESLSMFAIFLKRWLGIFLVDTFLKLIQNNYPESNNLLLMLIVTAIHFFIWGKDALLFGWYSIKSAWSGYSYLLRIAYLVFVCQLYLGVLFSVIYTDSERGNLLLKWAVSIILNFVLLRVKNRDKTVALIIFIAAVVGYFLWGQEMFLKVKNVFHPTVL